MTKTPTRLTVLAPFFFALISGGLLALAFSPVHLFWLSIVCPTVLLGLWLNCSAKKAAILGLIFGLGFFGVGASWILHSIYVYGNTPLIIAFIITASFVTVLASFFALHGYALQKFFPKVSIAKLLLVFPALWALLEWVRSWILTGFPWLLLGHSAIPSPIAGLAPMIGVYGLSFFITLLSGLLLIAANPRLTQQTAGSVNWAKSNIAGFALLILIGLANLTHYLHWTVSNPQTLRVSLIQGNIAQELRWDPAHLQQIIDRYQSLTEPLWKSNLIVWPEAAIPLTPLQAPEFYATLDKQAKKTHATLLLGLPIQRDWRYYNGAMALGNGEGTYVKRHLVPFGEYVPLEKQLRGLIGFFNLPMSDMLPGAVKQPLIQVDNTPVGTFICYEIAYNALLRQDLPEAELLVTISDDAWFGRSLAPWQHLQIAQFQAAATSRSLLFASNSGSSAFIDAKGSLALSIPAFIPGSVSFDVTRETGTTPWVYLGDTPFIVLFALLILLVYCRRK